MPGFREVEFPGTIVSAAPAAPAAPAPRCLGAALHANLVISTSTTAGRWRRVKRKRRKI